MVRAATPYQQSLELPGRQLFLKPAVQSSIKEMQEGARVPRRISQYRGPEVLPSEKFFFAMYSSAESVYQLLT